MRPTRLMILGLLTILVFSGGLTGPVQAAGLLPGAFPLSSGTELGIKKDGRINGNPIGEGKTGADSVLTVDGTRATVPQLLPALEPPTFPANPSTTEATAADSPFLGSTASFWKKITIGKHQTATFSGGGPFHLDRLEVHKGATLKLAAGTYFMNTVTIDKDSVLNLTSTPVILHLGSHAKVKRWW